MFVRGCERNLSRTNAASDDAGERVRVAGTHKRGDRHWYAAAARRYRACRSCRPGRVHWARNWEDFAQMRGLSRSRVWQLPQRMFSRVDLHFLENPSKTDSFLSPGSGGVSKTGG